MIPLAHSGSTGPILVFETIMFDFCKSVGFQYLPFRLWTGIWVGVIMLLLVASDASAFVCYITRYTAAALAASKLSVSWISCAVPPHTYCTTECVQGDHSARRFC